MNGGERKYNSRLVAMAMWPMAHACACRVYHLSGWVRGSNHFHHLKIFGACVYRSKTNGTVLFLVTDVGLKLCNWNLLFV